MTHLKTDTSYIVPMTLSTAGTEVNPFLDPLRFPMRPPACVLVVFGANGVPTERKLLPAPNDLEPERRRGTGLAVPARG